MPLQAEEEEDEEDDVDDEEGEEGIEQQEEETQEAEESKPSLPVEQADGLRLHLSSRNKTGYLNVVAEGNGGFHFKVWDKQAQKQVRHSSGYGTAVEAAVEDTAVVARAVGTRPMTSL